MLIQSWQHSKLAAFETGAARSQCKQSQRRHDRSAPLGGIRPSGDHTTTATPTSPGFRHRAAPAGGSLRPHARHGGRHRPNSPSQQHFRRPPWRGRRASLPQPWRHLAHQLADNGSRRLSPVAAGAAGSGRTRYIFKRQGIRYFPYIFVRAGAHQPARNSQRPSHGAAPHSHRNP